MTDRPVAAVMVAVANLHVALGAPPLNRVDGLWTADVPLPSGDVAKLYANGHGDELTTPDGARVPPYHVLFLTGDGLPLALVGPYGGTTVGDVIEDMLLAALARATAAVTPDLWGGAL